MEQLVVIRSLHQEKYYKDFSKGDYWNKVSLGEHRLPGAGYAKYNPELENVDPEKYPLVHQMELLFQKKLQQVLQK